MVTAVHRTDDPAAVLDVAGAFLRSDPVRHNLILTLLETRVAWPEPGRYWIVAVDGVPAGVVFQSPLDFLATITPMPSAAIEEVVDAIVADGVALPGVNGIAGSAARFAGQWTERTRSAASPTAGSRLYEVDQVVPPRPTGGRLRQADRGDVELLIAWHDAFERELGGGVGDHERTVDRRTQGRQLWLWEDADVVAMAGVSEAVAGVARLGPVYTPPERRSRGYASALVAAVSARTRSRGLRCILYTDLANPTSNAIYRALGYRAVDEALRYAFGPP
jgi:predicted GNAT family acetyltransferase